MTNVGESVVVTGAAPLTWVVPTGETYMVFAIGSNGGAGGIGSCGYDLGDSHDVYNVWTCNITEAGMQLVVPFIKAQITGDGTAYVLARGSGSVLINAMRIK